MPVPQRPAATLGSRRTGRLLALLISVGLLTGLTATAATGATPALPECKVADTLTKHRALTDWNRALLDTRYRLSSKHKPDRPPLHSERRPQWRIQGPPLRADGPQEDGSRRPS